MLGFTWGREARQRSPRCTTATATALSCSGLGHDLGRRSGAGRQLIGHLDRVLDVGRVRLTLVIRMPNEPHNLDRAPHSHAQHLENGTSVLVAAAGWHQLHERPHHEPCHSAHEVGGDQRPNLQ